MMRKNQQKVILNRQCKKKKKHLNLAGKIHALRYRFSLRLHYFLEIILTFFSLIVIILNFAEKSARSTLLVLVLAFSIGAGILGLIIKSLQIKKDLNLFLEVPNEKIDQTKSLSLTSAYKKSGYDYYIFDTGVLAGGENNAGETIKIKYIMSNGVNEHLYSSKMALKVLSKKFVLPKALRRFIPFAFRKFLRGEASVTNGKKWKQMDDIYLDTRLMRIQRTDYFTNLCTNEIVYKKIKNLDGIGDIFYGSALIEAKEGEKTVLCNLSESQCADIIGVDTLAISKDNYLIINRQGNRSFVGMGKFVPSGSGSAEKKGYKKGMTFNAFLEKEMERELKEELNLKKNTKVITRTMGYARLVEKGGKADFFGVSYIDKSFAEIMGRVPKSKEIKNGLMAMPTAIKIPTDENGNIKIATLADALEAFIDENRKDCSVQLEITKEAIKGFKQKQIELFNFNTN